MQDEAAPAFLTAGGEMAALMRAFDWRDTPLGPVRDWPQSLRTAVDIMLSSRYAMFVWWGGALTNLYNDAYRPFLGKKHPQALGQSASDVWAEIWDQIGPRTVAVLERGESTFDEALLLPMDRHGYLEETYFTFSYSPIRDDAGGIGGIFCAVTEETARVIGERRLKLLRDVGATITETHAPPEVCAAAIARIATADRDLPFALLYLADDDGRTARLVAQAGAGLDKLVAAPSVDLTAGDAVWPLAQASTANAPVLTADLPARFARLPAGGWDRPPTEAVVVPLAEPGQNGTAGFLVAGLNPYRQFDADYRGFIGLLAAQIAAGIANARAYETERKRAEALAEIDRAKTAFFSNVSHEFRTPLTLMLGPLEDALADPANAVAPPQRARLELAQRNALRLQRLVNALLDFSRVEAGRIQAVYRPTDLAVFTADIVSSFRSACDKAGLALTIDASPLPGPVFVDREMWEKIVLNLVSNAFKFTFAGGIGIALLAQDGHAVLRVSDTGVGIPEPELPRLFERFHRVAGTQGRTHEGTGIGLALVRELVNLHQGTIEVESRLGAGTTMSVRLPLGTRHLPQDRLETERGQPSTAVRADAFVAEALRWLPDLAAEVGDDTPLAPTDGPKEFILIADDNADMRDYLRQLLGQRYLVRLTANGAEALAALREHRPDLVLADIMMPELDGYGLLAAIRADPALADLPVLLLSARAGEEATIEGLDAGADDYLVKPFSARELIARLSTNLERARGRRRVRESEQRFRALVTTTSDVVYRMSPDWTEMWALDGRGILADTAAPSVDWIDEYLLPEDRPLVLAEIRAAIDAKAVFQLEHRVRRADGSVGWVFSRAIPLIDPLGEIVEWFGAASDVTDRVAAVRTLREVNETLEQRVAEALAERRLMAELVQTTDTFVQAVDKNFRFLAINDANAAEYEKLFGFRPRVGQSLADLLADRPALRAPVLAVWSRALAGEAFTTTEQFGDPALDRRYYEITFRPLRDASGEITGAYQFSTDVTDRREAEARLATAEEQLRQSQKMEAVGQLTGGIAHDFNNLLAGISGSLELLQKRLAQGRFDAVDRYIEAAQGASRRAASLTQRLLAFARRQTLDPRAVDLNRIVAGIADLIRRSVGPEVALDVVGATGLWLTLVDIPQIESALLNLCVNGRDAMAPDGGRLTVETANRWLDDRAAREHDVPPGQYVSLSVTDTGCGMPPEVIARAFEPFFTTKPLGQGTGLGLSMVHGFVRQSGGQVRIQSAPGTGSTVTLYLPRFDGEAEDRQTDLPDRAAPGDGETLLVVDDEISVRFVLAEELADSGYRVIEAADGASALRILQSSARIDLMITDVGLPGGLNGRQVADAARVSRPSLKILFITGFAETAAISNFHLGSAMEVMTKPFVVSALIGKVRELLSQQAEELP